MPRVLRVATAYLAFIATEFGTWVAILVYAYLTTGPLSVGVVAVAQLVPAALVAPFAATVGERLGRDRALALAYALLALTMGATGLAMLAGAAPLVVYPLAIVAQTALTTVRPMQAAIVPRLVGTADQLTAANALSMVLEGVGSLLGPLFAGVILALASPGAVFAFAGLACAVGCGLVVRAVVAEPAPSAADRAPSAADRAPSVADAHHSPRQEGSSPAPRPETELLAGMRAVRGSTSGILVIALIGLREVIAGALDVLLVFAAIELLGMGASGAGYLTAAVGLGAVVGGASTLALAGRPRLAPFLLLGAIAWGLCLGLLAVVPSPRAALLFLVAAGVGLAILQVSARTLLQRLLPVDALAGAFGVVEAFIFGGLAGGAFVAGPLVAILGLGPSILVLAVAMPIATALSLPALSRGERRLVIPLREIALLRRLRLFAPVPAPAVESAARRLVPVMASPGDAIVREGEVGDRFYVIATGTVAVRKGGREIRTLGREQAFGEIALLRQLPRTATVVALEPVELLALERDEFLLAITGTPQALDEAARVTDLYLAADAAADASA